VQEDGKIAISASLLAEAESYALNNSREVKATKNALNAGTKYNTEKLQEFFNT